MTVVFRIVGWLFLVGGIVMAVLSVAGTEDRALGVGIAAGVSLIGLALIKSKALTLENTWGLDTLGGEKISELRQNSRNAPPN